MNLAGQITVERILILVFVAGTLYERLRGYGSSLKSQGKRIGALEQRVTKLDGGQAAE